MNQKQNVANTSSSTKEKSSKHSVLETAATTVSVILIGSVVGFLAWEAFQPKTPPDILVNAGKTRQLENSYYVQVLAENRGRETAREVRLVGELTHGEETVDDAEVTIDWLPGNSRQEATIVFTEDPSSNTLSLRVSGFDKP